VDILISWPGGDWQATARLFAVLLTSYLLVFWFASVLWVYRDIRARTSDPVTQGIAVAIAVVFPIVGLPVYMVLRPAETVQQAYERQLEQEAILSELHSISACPSCRRPIDSDWVVCAHCASQLKTPCSGCGRPLQFSWRHCPHCATPRPRPATEAAPRREAVGTAADETARAAARAARAERAAPAETPREPRASRPAASADEPVTRPRTTRPRVRDDDAERGDR